MSNLIFLHSNHYPRCTAWVDKHFEDYFSLQWMESGSVELSYDDENYLLQSDEQQTWFWTAFPGPRIRFHPASEVNEWNHRYTAFSGDRVEQWKRAGLWLTIPQKAPRDIHYRFQFDELLKDIRRDGHWGKLRAIHALEGLLLELAEARSSTQEEPEWLEKVRLFLNQNHNFSPDYSHLAHELGMGLSTLRRNFKKATGYSLHDMLLQNRLDSARIMLGETNIPIKKIALEIGYSDVYFFSTQFKKLAGVTPAAYRKSRQG
jgi:AraC-like DNA-binding protein